MARTNLDFNYFLGVAMVILYHLRSDDFKICFVCFLQQRLRVVCNWKGFDVKCWLIELLDGKET